MSAVVHKFAAAPAAFAVLALLGGCGGDSTSDLVAAPAGGAEQPEPAEAVLAAPAATDEVADTGAEQPEPAEAVRLVYGYEPGARLTYQLEYAVEADTSAGFTGIMTTPGQAESVDVSQEVPELAEHDEYALKGDYSLRVGEGPRDGTFEINALFEVTESTPNIAAAVVGWGVTLYEEFAVVVDEHGAILSDISFSSRLTHDRLDYGIGLGDSMMGSSGLGDSMMGSSGLGDSMMGSVLLGPVLPDGRALAEGDTWTEHTTVDTYGPSILGYWTHRVADIQDDLGLLLIESTFESNAFTFEAGELLDVFALTSEQATFFGILSGSIGPITGEATTLLRYERSGAGPAAALVHSIESIVIAPVTLEMPTPDDNTRGLDGTVTVNIHHTHAVTVTSEDVTVTREYVRAG